MMLLRLWLVGNWQSDAKPRRRQGSHRERAGNEPRIFTDRHRLFHDKSRSPVENRAHSWTCFCPLSTRCRWPVRLLWGKAMLWKTDCWERPSLSDPCWR